MSQLDRDLRACVEFLATDPCCMFNALRDHVRGSHGWCAMHVEHWPCLTYRLAVFAEQLYRDREAARNLVALEGHHAHAR